MRFSIVTISYNQRKFLERAIKSVIEQDYDDIEYIIVDPGSTDGSWEIIEGYRDRIAKVIAEPDKGPPDGLNRGFACATGDICGCLNADDAYLPGAIGRVVAAFRRMPEADVICGHGYMVDAEGRVLRRFYSNRFTPWRYVHGGATVMQQSTFFRRETLADIGGFNPDNRIWWDGELLLDLSLAGKQIVIINEFWSIFTIHDQSISGQRGKDTERARRLDKERQRTRMRLYEKVMGRPLDRRARLGMIIARIQKWILHPKNTLWRCIEKLDIHIDTQVY
ncbi:MAG: glycosyltransferase [Desulfobacterales bacterium]|nr:glycosyltransferase [Desulfobacterales bacterium]